MTRTHLDVGLDLLDRHVVDRDGRDVGKVDDLELTERDDGTMEITALLLGPQALGRRVGGVLGRTMEGIGARLRRDDEPARIGLELVAELDVVITLTHPISQLPVGRSEAWFRTHVVEPIPGSRSATG